MNVLHQQALGALVWTKGGHSLAVVAGKVDAGVERLALVLAGAGIVGTGAEVDLVFVSLSVFVIGFLQTILTAPTVLLCW